MRKRSFWLFGGLVVALAVLLSFGPMAKAEVFEIPDVPPPPEVCPDHATVLGLDLLEKAITPFGPALLEVSVPEAAIGGFANLFMSIEEETLLVDTFVLEAPMFIREAPAPGPEFMGMRVSYQYEAFGAEGQPLGMSKTSTGFLEPEFE